MELTMNNNIEEHILNQLAEQVQYEIDFSVWIEASGWTLVDRALGPGYINYGNNNLVTDDLNQQKRDWLKENCQSEYKIQGVKIAFESPEDANWFRLKWL
jgi:hypothetical protein